MKWFLCDMVGTSIARELGMNFILIISGRESIEAALDQWQYVFPKYFPLPDSSLRF